MDSLKKHEVPFEKLCWTCNTTDFPFECTDELAPPQGLIGQDRAIRAIQFGLDLDKPGYNLFVTGLTGTGKTSAIKKHLQTVIDGRESSGVQLPIYDWCYVHNFADPDRPQMLQLPPGQGKRLHKAVEELLRTLKEEMPKLFSGDEYVAQRKQMEEDGRTNYQTRIQDLERQARAESFGLQISPAGVNLFPLTEEGGPFQPEEFMRLGEEERTAIDEKRNRLLQVVQDTMEQLRSIDRDTQDKVKELDMAVGDRGLSDMFGRLTLESDSLPAVADFLASLKEYALNNMSLFSGNGASGPSTSPQIPTLPSVTQSNPLLPFEITVLVDNSATRTAPIIIESNPTWGNLFGRIERRAFMGAYFSDHTMLKPGAVHHANGGYLVLNVRDLLQNPGVWEGLKRSIRDKEARLEDSAAQLGLLAPQGLRPQPLPWSAKVIVTGDESTYRLLSTYDQEDF